MILYFYNTININKALSKSPEPVTQSEEHLTVKQMASCSNAGKAEDLFSQTSSLCFSGSLMLQWSFKNKTKQKHLHTL